MAAERWIQARLKGTSQQLVYFGESMGTSVAIYLATKVRGGSSAARPDSPSMAAACHVASSCARALDTWCRALDGKPVM